MTYESSCLLLLSTSIENAYVLTMRQILEKIHPLASHTFHLFCVSDQTFSLDNSKQLRGSFCINYRLCKGSIDREKKGILAPSQGGKVGVRKQYDECLLIKQVHTLNGPGSSVNPTPIPHTHICCSIRGQSERGSV